MGLKTAQEVEEEIMLNELNRLDVIIQKYGDLAEIDNDYADTLHASNSYTDLETHIHMLAEEERQIARWLHEYREILKDTQREARGCSGCAFYNVNEWELPCSKCKRNCEDYWRAK